MKVTYTMTETIQHIHQVTIPDDMPLSDTLAIGQHIVDTGQDQGAEIVETITETVEPFAELLK